MCVMAVLLVSTGAARVPDPGSWAADGYGDAIRELVYVETSVDSDGDGSHDKVALFVIRPRATENGERVPVVLETDPYWAGWVDVPEHPAEVSSLPERSPWSPPPAGQPSDYSGGYYDNLLVPRGYAVVEFAALGTGDSEGCPSTGGPDEAAAVTAAAEWLTGGRAGHHPDGTPASATWSTGNLALVGLSYGGSLALAGAVAGAPGVRAVIASAAVTDWYGYYRANGAHASPRGYPGDDADIHAKMLLTRDEPERCADAMRDLERRTGHETGDRDAFWDDRDLSRDLSRLDAAVFLVAGVNDDNVRMSQSTRLWAALERADVERRMWLHQGGHLDPIDVTGSGWLALVDRYLDHHLRGADVGWDTDPLVSVETAPGNWVHHREWPPAGTRPVALAGRGNVEFVDDPRLTADELVAAGGQPALVSAPLPRPTRLSGEVEVAITASVDGPSPYLTALLVDFGTAERVVGRDWTEETWCFAPVTEEDGFGCRNTTEPVREHAPFRIVGRGWTDVRNRHSPYRQRDILPDHEYVFRWNIDATDRVFPRGHRIGVVFISTDREHTLRYPAGTRVSVNLDRSRVRLPLVDQ